jgi:hypothetical protein
LDPQFWLDDSKAYLGNADIIGLSRPSSSRGNEQQRQTTSRGQSSKQNNESDAVEYSKPVVGIVAEERKDAQEL